MAMTHPCGLHAEADVQWRSIAPHDAAATRYSVAAACVLAGASPRSRRAHNWIGAILRYEDFWWTTGRTPRENTRARETLLSEERNLGEWARYQRRFEGRLNHYQRARLDVSPAFEWDPLDHHWQANLAECVSFTSETGALPRLSSSNPAEFRLARWLGRQLHGLRLGRLDPQRSTGLSRLLQTSAQ